MSERTSITEYSKEELKQLHFELWDWLVNNPDKEKSSWPKWEELPSVTAYCSCFACVVVNNEDGNEDNNHYCVGCPLQVPTNELIKDLPNDYICSLKENFATTGVFNKWHYAKELIRKVEYAKIIRDSWK